MLMPVELFKLSARIFFISFILNFIWEMLQMPFYLNMPFDEIRSWYLCTRATLGDSVIITSIFWGTKVLRSLILKSSQQDVTNTIIYGLSGLLIAVAIEIHALRNGRWTYSGLMPVVPFLHVGLVPVLQLSLLTPLSIRLTLSWGDASRANETD